MTKLIVGLGNPGKKYENTYHNVGFMVIDSLLQKLGLTTYKEKFKSIIYEFNLLGEKIIIAKPQTFMNLSGEAVSEIRDFYKIDDSNILVVFDDLDLPKGSLRYRQKGSSGTHNGMRNIVQNLSSEKFRRLKIGTQKTNAQISTIDYVLMNIPSDEFTDKYVDTIKKATEFCQDFINGEKEEKLSSYNQIKG